MMKKYIYASWFIIIFTFSGILAYSTLYEIDSYQTVIDFKFQVSQVTITTNTTGEFENLIIDANIRNPSVFSSIRLKSVETTVFLNQQGSEYLRRLHWFAIIIPSGKNTSVGMTYEILPHYYEIFKIANSSANWNWSFDIHVNLVSSIIEEGQYDRSQGFQGVRILET
ncbi:MAG: hypothetical protein ACW98W_01880 [Candidatus Hodarchaeales archaeon]